MIIYTDNISPVAVDGCEMSPALAYQMENDFSNILDEISKGNIPTNTQRPFDVNFDLKKPKNDMNNLPPWEANPYAVI